jgi:hypothetical protein
MLEEQSIIKDYKPKAQKKFYRLYFSPYLGSYEMYYVITGTKDKNIDRDKDKNKYKNPHRYYLAVININTRFLFFIPLRLNEERTQAATLKALKFVCDLLQDCKQPMTNLRGDCNTAFAHIADNRTDLQNTLFLGVQKFYTDGKKRR